MDFKARWATLWEIPQAISFAITNRAKGRLDPRIYTYPTLHIMRVEDAEGNSLVYLPVHTGAILESLGWSDGLDPEHKMLAALTALEEIEREAWQVGAREVFFVSSDERVDEFCEKKLGYERVICMRKRLLP